MKERVEQSKNISKFFDLRDLNNIIQNSKIQKFKNSKNMGYTMGNSK